LQNGAKTPDFDLNTRQNELSMLRQEYRVALFRQKEHQERKDH
jgi:hypothetical protein